jgi:hypothetical protein
MQLPEMLVEYLINGSCALIWIWGSFKLFKINLGSVDHADLLLLVPGLYVVGMIVDHLAKLIREPLFDYIKKHKTGTDTGSGSWSLLVKLRKWILRFFRSPVSPNMAKSTDIILYSQDLGKQYVMRSSRDRIARGAFINTVLITVVFSLAFHSSLGTILPIGIALSVLCLSMWLRFEKSTSVYQDRAIGTINKDIGGKLRKDKP